MTIVRKQTKILNKNSTKRNQKKATVNNCPISSGIVKERRNIKRQVTDER